MRGKSPPEQVKKMHGNLDIVTCSLECTKSITACNFHEDQRYRYRSIDEYR